MALILIVPQRASEVGIDPYRSCEAGDILSVTDILTIPVRQLRFGVANRRDGRLQHIQPFVQLLTGDNQRNQDTNHIGI